jgi:hypothetical protein
MKLIARVGIGLIAIVVAVGGLLHFLPSDVVTSDYQSLAEARADGLFDRGWLPDILPSSAHSIRTSNNLDVSTSNGWFSFHAAEFPRFVAQVKPFKPVAAPFVAYDEKIDEMKRRGFQPLIYEEDSTVWVFFCESGKGYCEYDMWLRRG